MHNLKNFTLGVQNFKKDWDIVLDTENEIIKLTYETDISLGSKRVSNVSKSTLCVNHRWAISQYITSFPT